MENTTTGVVYVITNKETGESFRALPHTFGDNSGAHYVDFAPIEVAQDINEWMNTAKLQAEGKLYRFDNPDMNGVLTSDNYTIALEGK